MAPIPLTRRQRDIVEFFERYQQAHSISPTLEEIAQHLGVNKVTVFGHVAELERKGVLSKRAKRASRSLELVESPRRATAREGAASLQIVGAIAAGRPIEAIEDPQALELPQSWKHGAPDRYALRVRGNSMIEDCICDGDVVIIEKRPSVQDGETVVAILPGEVATLKRLYREGDRYRLQPANAQLSPTFVPVAEIEIRGVMVGLVRGA